jgi:hypothetical protein
MFCFGHDYASDTGEVARVSDGYQRATGGRDFVGACIRRPFGANLDPECGNGQGNPFAVNPPELAVDKPRYWIFMDRMEITHIRYGSQMVPPRPSLL